jgi:hypothetical protein
MKKADLRKKLAERSPLSPTRPMITPVDLYDTPKENKPSKETETGAKSHYRTIALSHQNTIARVNRGYKLREDIIRDMKNLATNSNRKLYDVMEEAMLDYLKKHSA